MIGRGTFRCICGGFCLLLPAAVAAVFAPLMCKKHKEKAEEKSKVKSKKSKVKNKK